MTNQFPGLARGPIDHEASSVINVNSTGAITMGSAVALSTATIPSSEILPEVGEISTVGSELGYGVAVGGVTDGVFGDGTAAAGDAEFEATTGQGEAVVIVTRGRCPARVFASKEGANTPVTIGLPLTLSGTAGALELANTGDVVIARALQAVASGALDIIAVEVNKEGIL